MKSNSNSSLDFLAEVVQSRDEPTVKSESNNNKRPQTVQHSSYPEKKSRGAREGIANRWVPQLSNHLETYLSNENRKWQEDMRAIMPVATPLESIDLDDDDNGNDNDIKSSRLKRRASVRDEAAYDMINSFFQKAGNDDERHARECLSRSNDNTDLRLGSNSGRAKDGRRKVPHRKKDQANSSQKQEMASSETTGNEKLLGTEQIAAEMLTRIPSEDLHANSRDWQDSNFANGLSFGSSMEGGVFNLSTASGEFASSSLNADIFRSGSNSALGRGVFSTDSLDTHDHGAFLERYGSGSMDHSSRLQPLNKLSSCERIDGRDEEVRISSYGNKICLKCGLFVTDNVHICPNAKSSLRLQSPGKRYLVENSDQYNVWMLEKYTGISATSKNIAVPGTGVRVSLDPSVKLPSQDCTFQQKRSVSLCIKLSRSVIPAELAMLGIDAKVQVANILKCQLLQVEQSSSLRLRLQYHEEYMEMIVKKQNQEHDKEPKRILTMTGGGLSVGPSQVKADSSTTSQDGNKRELLHHSQDAREGQTRRAINFIEDMEEYSMGYAMRMMESHVHISEQGTHGRKKSTKCSYNDNNLDKLQETKALLHVEKALEKKYARFTDQIENYLGPSFYRRNKVGPPSQHPIYSTSDMVSHGFRKSGQQVPGSIDMNVNSKRYEAISQSIFKELNRKIYVSKATRHADRTQKMISVML